MNNYMPKISGCNLQNSPYKLSLNRKHIRSKMIRLQVSHSKEKSSQSGTKYKVYQCLPGHSGILPSHTKLKQNKLINIINQQVGSPVFQRKYTKTKDKAAHDDCSFTRSQSTQAHQKHAYQIPTKKLKNYRSLLNSRFQNNSYAVGSEPLLKEKCVKEVKMLGSQRRAEDQDIDWLCKQIVSEQVYSIDL